MPTRTKTLACALAALVACGVCAPARAQVKEPAEGATVFCDPQRALEVAARQGAEAKLLEAAPARIAVLVRVADVLWAHEQERARALFSEAFEAASRHFRETGYETRTEKLRQDSKMSGLGVMLPDQRFVVVSAVARRDASWARRLAEQVAEEARREAEGAAANRKAEGADSQRNVGDDIVTLAESLLETDAPSAVGLARGSLRGPFSWNLPDFLYRVAERDRAAADSLYRDALAAYAGRDTEALLHLSSYPFGFNYTIAPVSRWRFNRPAAGFAAGDELQRQYLAAFVALAERRLKALAEQPPAAAGADAERAWTTEAARIYTALLALESLMGARLEASAAARLASARTQAAVLVPAQSRARAASDGQREFVEKPGGGGAEAFERAFEQAQQQKEPERREMSVALAISQASEAVGLARLEEALRAVGDDETRRQLSNWLHFTHSQKAAKEGALDEATRLAERVDALDERAMLFLDIAAEGIRRFDDRQRASELLEAVAAAALKAPDTVARARAQLGVAHLYAGFDYPRASEVMGEAVKTVNRLAAPDFSKKTFIRRIEGKNFNSFKSHPVPGFNLENAFGELGAFDFEGVLAHAHGLKDTYLRATAALAVAARCLGDSARRARPEKKPTPKGKAKGTGRGEEKKP